MRAWCCVTIKTKTTVTHINLLMRETVRVAQIEQNQANHQTKKISLIILRAIYRDLNNCGRYCRKFFYFISWWKSWEKSLHWVTIDFSFEERARRGEGGGGKWWKLFYVYFFAFFRTCFQFLVDYCWKITNKPPPQLAHRTSTRYEIEIKFIDVNDHIGYVGCGHKKAIVASTRHSWTSHATKFH